MAFARRAGRSGRSRWSRGIILVWSGGAEGMKRVILVLCIAVLGGAGFVAYQVLRPHAPVAKPLPPADAARAAGSFDQKWDALHSKAPDSKDVTVELSQDEVTAKVDQMIGGGDKPVKDVAVKVVQDAAVVSAVVQVGGHEIPVAVSY